MSGPNDRIVVVGAGVAGVSAAGAARLAGFEGEIVLLGGEDALPYRRPTVSKELVRGDKGPDEVRIKPEFWYEKNAVDLRTGVRVESIDAETHEVRLSDGSTLGYDQLLLATGGRPRRLAEGDSGAVTLREIGDADQLRERLDGRPDVVVVGAGLIGSEIAASARQLGCAVTLLETAPLPMPRVLPADLGRMYADWHAAEGTQLHTDVRVRAIRPDADDSSLTVVEAEDGRTWTAPVVVEAVGMTPDVELAHAAGVRLDDELGGVLVDEVGRTNVADVFAAGDVASMPDLVRGGRHRVEHWQNAQNHGAAVGRAMAGVEKPFDEVPWCWSDQYGGTLQITGWPDSSHTVVVRGDLGARDFTAFYLDADGVLLGAVGLGRPREIRSARGWIGERRRLDAARLGDEAVALEETLVP